MAVTRLKVHCKYASTELELSDSETNREKPGVKKEHFLLAAFCPVYFVQTNTEPPESLEEVIPCNISDSFSQI